MRLTTPARIAWPARSGSVASHVEPKPESRSKDFADGGDGRLGHRFADTPVFPGGPSPAPHMVQRTSIVEGIAMVTGLDRERERGGLLVDDDVEKLATGQMRKREFFPELRTMVHATAERELSRVGRSAADCPYLEKWLAYYEGRPAAHLERALRRYARAATLATKALDYLEPVGQQLAQGIAAWTKTGVMAGIPDELVDNPGDPGKLQSKARAGESPGSVDAGAIAAQLGPGRPIPDGVRGRMEDALDVDFAHVRIHTDGTTPRLAGELGARAFTVGHHVAFGADQFRPGDPAGDALLAHELAHVAQQTGGGTPGPMSADAPEALEREADDAATAAIAQLHGSDRDVRERPRKRLWRGRAMRLSRCDTYTPLATTDRKESDPPPWRGRKEMEKPLQSVIRELWNSKYDVDHNTAANLSWGYPPVYMNGRDGELINKTKSGKRELGQAPDFTKNWVPDLEGRWLPTSNGGGSGEIDRDGNGDNPIMLLDSSLFGTDPAFAQLNRDNLKTTIVHEMSHATNTAFQKNTTDPAFAHWESEFRAYWVQPDYRKKSDEDKVEAIRKTLLGTPSTPGRYDDIWRAYWKGNDPTFKTRVDNYKLPDPNANLTNQWQLSEEDWDFTGGDYQAMKAQGSALRFADDSAWFPLTFQNSLLKTLEMLLDPTTSPDPTVGVNTKDFFHGHVGVPKDKVTPELLAQRDADADASHKAYKDALGVANPERDEKLQYSKALDASNLAAFGKAVTATLPSATALLQAAAAVPGAVVVFHTKENNWPLGKKDLGSEKRNFKGPAGEVTQPFKPPDSQNADSWEQGASAPYEAIYQFSFLIDVKGVIHVRPWAHAVKSDAVQELSTVTGKPKN